MDDMEKITELIANKQFNEAKILINDAISTSPDNIELLKLAGLTEVNLGNWTNAQKHFETVVKFSQEDATSWFYLANCYENLSALASAKAAYLKVIDLRPEYEDAYSKLCIIFLRTGAFEDAVKYAQTALKYNADYTYYYIIGTAKMNIKDFNGALKTFQQTLKLFPNKIEILNSIGTCYTVLGNMDEAIKIYQKAITINPNFATTYYNLGSIYQIKQNHEEAIKYLEKAVEIEDNEKFLVALAMSEMKVKDYDCALKHYKNLATMFPGKENYKFNIVMCYEAMLEFDVAIRMLEEMVYVNPKFILPAQKLATLYMRTNKLNKAKEIYDNILLKNKPNSETLHEYAILSSSLNDTETAEKILKKVIRMSPKSASAHKDLAIIFLNKRLFDYAKEEFEIALKLEPNNFETIFEYGNYLYSISKNTEAERYYTEALELQPENIMALVFMALNKLVLNQVDSAYEYIMKAIKIEPNHEYIQFCAGRILFARKEYEEAKPYLIRAVEQNPDIETMNTLALTYYELGNYKQALNIFSSISKKSPKSISVLMDMARCYEALKENDSALAVLNKVTDIFPDNEDAHEMIRRLS
ncbi:MAG: tetratricopeptide repeat protein [bacterium]|nr:tetratricopeptide repeat protein [bacterium]